MGELIRLAEFFSDYIIPASAALLIPAAAGAAVFIRKAFKNR